MSRRKAQQGMPRYINTTMYRECPYCGAYAYTPCRNTKGVLEYVHVERVQ